MTARCRQMSILPYASWCPRSRLDFVRGAEMLQAMTWLARRPFDAVATSARIALRLEIRPFAASFASSSVSGRERPMPRRSQ